MNVIIKLNKWANARTNFLTDALRVVFGLYIFYKGLTFMQNTGYLMSLIDPVDTVGATLFLAHYVAFAHLAGGILIVMGLLTRVAVLFQIPVIIGAIAINYVGAMDVVNLAQAWIALGFCFLFLLFGSGKHSLDYQSKLNV